MKLGLSFHRDVDAAELPDIAARIDGKLDQLWVIEDVFYTSGPALAAAALTATEQLTVGVGILPSRVRAAAVTAMEFATLGALGPGRFIGGLGHGVQPWMEQIGLKPASPLTALEETLDVVRRLLRGERINVNGRYVTANDVKLDMPPPRPVPVYAGVQRPKSFALAGAHADGLIMAGTIGPDRVRAALSAADRDGDFPLIVFSTFIVASTRQQAYEFAAHWLAGELGHPSPAMSTLPCYEELLAHWSESGRDGLTSIPREWWLQLGAIGTLDDAADHVAGLADAGATGVSLFGSADPQVLRNQLPDMIALAERLRD